MLSSPDPFSPPPTDQKDVAMETYWGEVQNIEEERDEDERGEVEDEMDEAELEEAWLTEAGLSSLVTGTATGEGPADALLSTLTRQQVATVKERLENYNQTLRRKNRPAITNVQEVFHMSDAVVAEPSRPHRTKTIHKATTRVRPTFPDFQMFKDDMSAYLPPPHTQTPQLRTPKDRSEQADWLCSDLPYSEGVSECRRGVAYPGDGDLVLHPPASREDLVRVEDLSPADLTQLGYISLIELTTFFSSVGVQVKKGRPTRRRARDSGVFGVSLTTLLDKDRRKNCSRDRVPVVFRKLLTILEETGLQTEGILRVPGSAARLKYLRTELDNSVSTGQFDWSVVRQQEAAGLLKMFIRELPSPLMTSQLLPYYTTVLGISFQLHQIQALHLLTLLLPEANRDLLKALLSFLSKVVSHQEKNRMSLWNVSMVIAPNLFTSHHGNKSSFALQQEEMEEAVGAAHLVRLLITHQDLLWTVPSFLMSQVRRMNQVASHKTGLLRKRENKNDKNQLPDLWEGVIRVHAPLHAKVSMAVQLDGQTKAKDVVARFQYENRTGHGDKYCLFEVGGNIGERRLHPDTLLMDVYLSNPRCDWLLKPRRLSL